MPEENQFIEDYEDEIVGLFHYKRYNKDGRNGCMEAVTDYIKENEIIVPDDFNFDYVIDHIFWS